MTDEQIWLLRYGRGWVPWYELIDGPVGEQKIDVLHERLTDAGKLEVDRTKMRVRLKENKE